MRRRKLFQFVRIPHGSSRLRTHVGFSHGQPWGGVPDVRNPHLSCRLQSQVGFPHDRWRFEVLDVRIPHLSCRRPAQVGISHNQRLRGISNVRIPHRSCQLQTQVVFSHEWQRFGVLFVRIPHGSSRLRTQVGISHNQPWGGFRKGSRCADSPSELPAENSGGDFAQPAAARGPNVRIPHGSCLWSSRMNFSHVHPPCRCHPPDAPSRRRCRPPAAVTSPCLRRGPRPTPPSRRGWPSRGLRARS